MSYSDYVKKWEEKEKKEAGKVKDKKKINKSTTIKYKKKVNRLNLNGKK